MSPLPIFFNVWIFPGWGRRLQRLRGSRMWTLNYLTMVYDRVRITRWKVKLLLAWVIISSSYDKATRSKFT